MDRHTLLGLLLLGAPFAPWATWLYLSDVYRSLGQPRLGSVTSPTAQPVRFRDFSGSEEPITFRIAPDTFSVKPDIALDTLMDMSGLSVEFAGADAKGKLAAAYRVFEAVLTDESYTLMRARCAPEHPYPIGVRLLNDVLPWLLEVYGLRPTEPSDESSPGSVDDGTGSTGTASTEE